jgi:hypothetical protein
MSHQKVEVTNIGTGPVLPVFLHGSFGTLQKYQDKMCPIQDFTFRNYFEIFFSVVKGIIVIKTSGNIIFFYKMMNLFNFPSSNKVLGLGRSIFCEKRFTTSPPAV